MTTPSIYVGTYAKYNNGSIFGAWLDLTKYEDAEDFYKACAELHNDEQDPEFMYQDFEGFPSSLYCEAGGIAQIYEYIDAVRDSNLPDGVIDAGLAIEIPLDQIEDRFIGEYESTQEFAEEYFAGKIDDNHPLYNYIDWDRVWDCQLRFDFDYENGFMFAVR